jgi:plasmid stability protein
MWITCDHTNYMPIMVQIRNVPDELHRKMKSRAALAGKSLSDYLLAELREIAERPSLDELRARLAARSGFTPSIPSADVIRAERDRG